MINAIFMSSSPIKFQVTRITDTGNALKTICANYKLECAASNGNRYPPYPQVYLPIMTTALLCPNPNLRKKNVYKESLVTSLLV